MFYQFLVIFCLTSFAVAGKITYKTCTGKKIMSNVITVDVSGCGEGTCQLVRGKNASIEIDFNSEEEVKNPINSIHGIIGGIPVPFPTPESCCDNKNLKCPVETGSAKYQLTIPVKTEFPKLQLLVEIEVKDDNRNDLLCIVFPAKLV